jgi:hypothetical protein
LAPHELLCGVRSKVAGMAGSLTDAHRDADVEVNYQIIVNLTGSHAFTAATSRVKSTPMWSVHKVSDFWQGEIHLHAWNSATQITFEVVFL